MGLNIPTFLLYMRAISKVMHMLALTRNWWRSTKKITSLAYNSSLEHLTIQTLSLHLRDRSFSNPSVASPTPQLILQSFRRFTYATVHSPILPSLHLRHSSFSNPSVASPTSQLNHQPFRSFTYVTANSPILPSLHLRHISFTNPSVASPTSQFILQSFRRFTYVTAHFPILPSLHLRHSSFTNPFVASPTTQFILQPFFRFSYVTGSSLTSRGEPPMDLGWDRTCDLQALKQVWKCMLFSVRR